jgi:hypothetical protein
MTPAPTATVANAFVANDPTGRSPFVLYVVSATVQYLYTDNGWVQIPSGALATFGAGACAVYHPWSNTYTANGGSTTTATVAAGTHNITGLALGDTIEFVASGTNNGLQRTITGVINNAGTGTITIQWSGALSTAVLNTHTFRISTGRFFVYGGGATTAGSFKSFDVGTMSWSGNLTVTGVPTFTGDGRMALMYQLPKSVQTGLATAVTNATNATISDNTKSWKVNQWIGYWVRITAGAGSPNGSTGAINPLLQITSNTANQLVLSGVFATAPDTTSIYSIEAVLASGVATSGSTTTLVNSTKSGGSAWTANQWTNSRVRIVGGTGLGQTSIIASNTGDTLTIGTVGTAIASGSIYEIEGDENFIYLAGNAAVAMYKYSISAGTWATVAPTTARTTAPGASPSLNAAYHTGCPNWSSEPAILNGRYLYSFRGAASGVVDRFDIAGGTAGAGAWAVVTVVNAETFTTGASFGIWKGKIYIRKESASGAAQRFFYYDVVKNALLPFTTLNYPDGAALAGIKIWVKTFDYNQTDADADAVNWLYTLQSTGTALHRIMLF